MKHTNANQKYISIEGNIGSGKSTFIKKITQELSIPTVLEPHQEWQNVNNSGCNILQEFYSDIKRWAYSFQTYVFLTRIKELHRVMGIHKNDTLFLAERSVIADRYTFALMCYEAGNISEVEWNMYIGWYDWLTNILPVMPQGIIYLQTSPEVSYERIGIRHRKEEDSIPFDYIKNLHNKHEDWLIKKQFIQEKIVSIPVLVLSCNEDFEHNENQWKNHVEKIKDFLMTINANQYNISENNIHKKAL